MDIITQEALIAKSIKSFEVQFAFNNNANGNEFNFVVLDNVTSKVLGYSTTTGKVANSVTTKFEFVSADGTSPLTLSSTTTYRYLAVIDDVVATISADTTKNYIYNGGNTATLTLGTSGADSTISGGLVVVSGRAYASQTEVYSDCLYISGANGTSSSQVSGYNVHVVPTNIKVATVTPTATIPEPTTATLSLLALAGLAARRRRK